MKSSKSSRHNHPEQTPDNGKKDSRVKQVVRHFFGHSGNHQSMNTQDSANDYQGMNTGRRSSNYGLSSSQQSSDTAAEQTDIHQLTELDSLTLELVSRLKNEITGSKQFKNKESIIEFNVAKIRQKLIPSKLDYNRWKDDLSREMKNCPDPVLHRSMAYGDHPGDVKSVLRAKIEEYKSNPNKDEEDEAPTDTSLDKIIDPLRGLYQKMRRIESFDLFRTVVDMEEENIDRADRMFYSQARLLIEKHGLKEASTNYTLENAHDQVQAIRLLHYEAGDEEVLCNLIKRYHTFDETFSYLKNRLKATESSANKKSDRQFTKPIVRDAPEHSDDDTHDKPTLTNTYPQSSNNNNQQQRPSSGVPSLNLNDRGAANSNTTRPARHQYGNK